VRFELETARRPFVPRQLGWVSAGWLFPLLAIGIFNLAAIAQSTEPIAQLPSVYIDTTWNPPTGGTTWAAHTAAQLTSALSSSQPGDIIVLDAGVTYSGNFHLPVKANPNNKWIYVISSALANLPAGTRVSPSDASSMPKIVTPTVAPAFEEDGGDHWRLAGLEITAASNYPTGCPGSGANCMTYFLIGSQFPPSPMGNNITIDRCYAHGSPTQDLQQAITSNWTYAAVIDSYIDDVHIKGFDSVGLAQFDSTGPTKYVNNYVSASTENIMFGGAGGNTNVGVPSDIEIRNNYLYKPLSWVVASVTNNAMVVKNAFECKSCQRVLFDSNVIENVWAHGQMGYAIVLTVRSSQSGDFAVVNDITITNNVLKNVVSGVNTLAEDDTCGAGGGYPNCNNPGSQERWYIANNLILHYDPTILGGNRNLAIAINGGINRLAGNTPGTLRDVVFQHNTAVSAASTPCWGSIYFSSNGQAPPFPVPLSNNIWILDNALCDQPTGDWGLTGTSGLKKYMGLPNDTANDIKARFVGNIIWIQPGTTSGGYSNTNLDTTDAFTYINPSANDYQLLTPVWKKRTSDGQQAGVNNNNLPAF
jgi:hypothetical protein